jgi:hypothetical protein
VRHARAADEQRSDLERLCVPAELREAYFDEPEPPEDG